MKIGFILPNLAGGGAEKAVLKLAAALLARGHDAHLILLEDIVAYEPFTGIKPHILGREGRSISKGWLGKRLAARKLSRLITRLEHDNTFDLLVSTLPFADEVAILAELPRHWCRIANSLSAEVRRIETYDRNKAARRIARYQKLYGNRLLIAVSNGAKQDIHTILDSARPFVEIIPNPFDFEALRAESTEPADLPDEPYIVHAGRFAWQKRHDVLLDAFARLRTPHRLVLLANPDAVLSHMIETRGLGTRVIVAGFQKNPSPWIAGADLLVLTSDHEGLPNVIIEALALGTPVVSTDCPSGPREILGEMLGDCLVPVGDPLALVAAMERTLANPPDVSRVDLSRYEILPVVTAYERLARERP